jgi:hypothetical protein
MLTEPSTLITNQMKENQQIIDLKESWLSDNRLRFPNVPEHGRACPRFNDKTANGLTRCIITFLRLNGHQAERVNTMGRQIKAKSGKMIYIPTTGSKGSADISATINGLSVKLEVKVGRDRQSERQQRYQEQIMNAGGIYHVATDFQSFTRWYNMTFVDNKNS